MMCVKMREAPVAEDDTYNRVGERRQPLILR